MRIDMKETRSGIEALSTAGVCRPNRVGKCILQNKGSGVVCGSTVNSEARGPACDAYFWVWVVMNKKNKLFLLLLAMSWGVPWISVSAATVGEALSLRQLEDLALRRDPMISKYLDEADAMAAQAVASQSRPDPKLKLGLMNVPVDSFDLAQEPMTQEVIGIQQMFPSGNMLRSMGDRMSHMGEAREAQAANRRLETLREVRKAWLNLYQAFHASNIVRQSQKVFEDLVKIVGFQYRSGQGSQQDVIRAQLELDMLKDKEIELDTMLQMAQSKLTRWVGREAAVENLQLDAVSLPEVPERSQISFSLKQHPMVAMKDNMATAAQMAVEVARSKYDIAWMIDLSYGFRQPAPNGTTRADMLSAMVMVDLPFFTGKRQDKWLAASEKEYGAARSEVEDTRLAMQAMLDAQYAVMENLLKRLAFYRDTVLPGSSQNAEAALKAYQSRTGDFTPLMRARLMDLMNKLTALRLLVEQAEAQTELLYLAGDRKS